MCRDGRANGLLNPAELYPASLIFGNPFGRVLWVLWVLFYFYVVVFVGDLYSHTVHVEDT